MDSRSDFMVQVSVLLRGDGRMRRRGSYASKPKDLRADNVEMWNKPHPSFTTTVSVWRGRSVLEVGVAGRLRQATRERP